MSKPKIAVLIDWYLPGTKAGGPVRSVYSLVNLLRSDFDFYIITTNVDLGSTQQYPDVVANELFFKNEVHYYFFSPAELKTRNMLDLLHEIKPDLVYLNSFWSLPFSISIINFKHKRAIDMPVLLAPRGMLGKGAMSLKSLKKRFFLSVAKLMGWYNHIPFHATQPQEELDIRRQFPTAKICLAPNINSSPVMENTSTKEINQLNLFFLSRIAEVKNLHFALELLRSVPENYRVVYDIYGNLEDKEYWSRCKQIIEKLPSNVRVEYKGELQFNKVQSTICQYNGLFLPTLNENFGHSIVESLLCGCPVIISDQTPWNDLEQHNAGYAIALNDKQKFREALLTFAGLNHNEFVMKSQAAAAYISSKLDVAAIKNQYKNLFNECIKN